MQTTSSSKVIIIISSSRDKPVWQPVVDRLHKRGYATWAYETDKVARGDVGFNIQIDSESAALKLRYGNQQFRLSTIAAAWYRRPGLLEDQKDKVRQLCLATECAAVQYSLWDLIPRRAWLNAPLRLNHAEHKLTQLLVAKEVGFAIPETIIANTWEPIQEGLPREIIFKASSTLFYKGNGSFSIYTKPFHNRAAQLPLTVVPFPGFWQPHLRKTREWRITVVGDTAFDAAIYTNKNAKDDWRLHQDGPRVRFKHETFPQEQKEKCFAFLKKFNLQFGAFDFIEDEEGTITFLECNPNGQFGWLEDKLGLPISDAIADRLAAIADRS